MGRYTKSLDSESIGVGGDVGNRLEEPDLEEKMSTEQIANLLEREEERLAEKLNDYAEMRPASRERITQAFNLYIRRHKRSKTARTLKRKVQGLLALTMLEALSES